jgi:hypothetical protein
LIGLSPEDAPDPACLREGLAIFREDHHRLQQNQSPLRLLTGLGARLWRLRMEAAETAEAAGEESNDSDDDDVQAEDSAQERVWTPEAVSKSVGHMVMHSAHLIRRARWFCLLSESSLAWEAAGRPGHLKNLIVLEGGSVIQRDTIENAEEVPVPARYDRSFHRRQKHLSLITYDRLRILTTELRRLISENRHIELRLGPTVTLGNDELKKASRWV